MSAFQNGLVVPGGYTRVNLDAAEVAEVTELCLCSTRKFSHKCEVKFLFVLRNGF